MPLTTLVHAEVISPLIRKKAGVQFVEKKVLSKEYIEVANALCAKLIA